MAQQVGRFWCITDYSGPWQVSSYSDGRGQIMDRTTYRRAGSWYIVNKDTGKSKRIGPVRRNGVNFHDRACEEAKRRNALISCNNWESSQIPEMEDSVCFHCGLTKSHHRKNERRIENVQS